MLEIIKETLIDSAKLLPFLFVAFLLLEYIEHKVSKKNQSVIKKSGKFGPLLGGVLGIFPQCGFSVMATNLYAARIITIGTLISIYLTTSDEMLPIMLSENIEISIILKILFIKLLVGIICGFFIDLLFRKKNSSKNEISEFCTEEHCDCKHSLFKSSLKHTINIIIFIVIASFVLNSIIYFIGEENLANLFTNNKFLGPLVSSLIGLIPNCASSVIITEMYLTNIISVGSMLSGLLTGSGVALIILFRVNKNKIENLQIISIIYLVGVVAGIVMNMIGLHF